MSIKNITKTVLQASGNTYRSVAPAFGVSEETSASKLGRGIKSVEDLIKLCDFCGTRIFLELPDGTLKPISIQDLD